LGGAINLGLAVDKARAITRIADTGIGIAASDLPHVFDGFWRADKVRTRAEGAADLVCRSPDGLWSAMVAKSACRASPVRGRHSPTEPRDRFGHALHAGRRMPNLREAIGDWSP